MYYAFASRISSSALSDEVGADGLPLTYAAFLAGLGAGLWTSKAQVAAVWKEQRAFAPTADRAAVDEHLQRWNAAVAKA